MLTIAAGVCLGIVAAVFLLNWIGQVAEWRAERRERRAYRKQERKLERERAKQQREHDEWLAAYEAAHRPPPPPPTPVAPKPLPLGPSWIVVTCWVFSPLVIIILAVALTGH
jgi:type II secretory pathway pseudopilin PulG